MPEYEDPTLDFSVPVWLRIVLAGLMFLLSGSALGYMFTADELDNAAVFFITATSNLTLWLGLAAIFTRRIKLTTLKGSRID